MTTSTNSFFDLHTSGVGYVNRIREVAVKRGDAFMACDISALTGPSSDVEYRRFDVKVSGKLAEKLVRKLSATVKDRQDKGLPEPKILIGFKLGDLWFDTFTYSKGDKAGQTGVSLKARLLFIDFIKVDGEMKYQAPKRQETSDAKTDESTEQPAAEPIHQTTDVGGSASAGEAAPAQQAQPVEDVEEDVIPY